MHQSYIYFLSAMVRSVSSALLHMFITSKRCVVTSCSKHYLAYLCTVEGQKITSSLFLYST